MENNTDSTQKSVEEIFDEYGNMLYRISFVLLKNGYDAEDAVQDTLIKYMECHKVFETEEYRKAWLIRVIINICKNKLRFYKNHPQISVEQLSRYYKREADTYVMDCLLQLGEKYREVLFLYYVEGYKSKETAKILGISENSVRKRLERGRKELEKMMKET